MQMDSHQIVRDFLGALRDGALPDDMLTVDFEGWTVLSGPVDRATYQKAFGILGSIFEGGGPQLTIHSITAEDHRAVAEFTSEGKLRTGDLYRNDYLFLFRLRDGRVAYVGEYFNPDIVREKLAPAMAAAMARSSS